MRKLIPIFFLVFSANALAQTDSLEKSLLQAIKSAREQIVKAPTEMQKIEVYAKFKTNLEHLEFVSSKNANAGNRDYRMTLIALNEYLAEIHSDNLTTETCAQYEAVIRDNGAIRTKLAKKGELFGEATEALSFLKLLCPPY